MVAPSGLTPIIYVGLALWVHRGLSVFTGSYGRDDVDVPPLMKRTLSWKVSQYGDLGSGATHSEVDNAIRKAFKMWSDICNINFYQTSGSPDIDIRFTPFRYHTCGGNLAFGSSTLAHVAPRTSNPYEIHFNDQQEFTLDESDMDLPLLSGVAAHEIGHVLGIGHDRLDASSLMAGTYQRGNDVLTSRDIAAAREKYPTTARSSCPETVTRYATSDSTGRSFEVCAIVHDGTGCTGAGRLVGEGPVNDLRNLGGGGSWANRISSAEVNPGCTLKLCTRTYLNGICMTRSGGPQGQNVGSMEYTYDDNTESLSCYC